jgi:hypothetical protein
MSEDGFFEVFLEEHPADIDIDKAWDALDYLMSRATQEKNFPVGFFHQGTPLGLLAGNWDDDDSGVRWFNEDEKEIYPEIWVEFESLLLCRQQKLSLSGASPVSPTIILTILTRFLQRK